MKIEKKTEWVLPKGTHQARIAAAFLVVEEGEQVLKIIATLTSLQHPLKRYTLRLVYKGRDLQKFVADFSNIIGEEEVARFFTLNGELVSDSLAALVDVEFDVETSSYQGHGHQKPCTTVVRVAAIGVLTDEFDKAA